MLFVITVDISGTYLFIHDDINDRVPEYRALGQLKRQDSEDGVDGGGHAEDARHGEDGVGRPAEQEHKHQDADLRIYLIRNKEMKVYTT